MSKLFLWSCVSILLLVLNTIYSFLPSKIQDIQWVKFTGITVAVIILIGGVYKTIHDYRNQTYAYISSDGTIIESNNFPWKIKKFTTDQGEVGFNIEERYGDPTDVHLKLDDPNIAYEKYLAFHGVSIKFKCLEEDVPNIKITID